MLQLGSIAVNVIVRVYCSYCLKLDYTTYVNAVKFYDDTGKMIAIAQMKSHMLKSKMTSDNQL